MGGLRGVLPSMFVPRRGREADATMYAYIYTRHHDQVGHYHAEMPQQDRERTHRQWSQGKIPCICATVAFGMGINKVCQRLWFVGRDGSRALATCEPMTNDTYQIKPQKTQTQPDVRYVIHFSLPKSLTHYYQVCLVSSVCMIHPM